MFVYEIRLGFKSGEPTPRTTDEWTKLVDEKTKLYKLRKEYLRISEYLL